MEARIIGRARGSLYWRALELPRLEVRIARENMWICISGLRLGRGPRVSTLYDAGLSSFDSTTRYDGVWTGHPDVIALDWMRIIRKQKYPQGYHRLGCNSSRLERYKVGLTSVPLDLSFLHPSHLYPKPNKVLLSNSFSRFFPTTSIHHEPLRLQLLLRQLQLLLLQQLQGMTILPFCLSYVHEWNGARGRKIC